MEQIIGGNAVWLAIAAFIILCIFLGVRIVPQSEKHVVERFGRLRAVLGPGSGSAGRFEDAARFRERLFLDGLRPKPAQS